MSNPYDTTVHVPEVSQSSAPNWTPEHKWPGSLELPCDDRLPNWFSLKSRIVGNCGTVAMAYPDYDRARDCVKACKGMADPAAEIERLKAVEKAADELLETLETERISNVGPYARIEAIRLIQSIGRYNAAKKGDRK